MDFNHCLEANCSYCRNRSVRFLYKCSQIFKLAVFRVICETVILFSSMLLTLSKVAAVEIKFEIKAKFFDCTCALLLYTILDMMEVILKRFYKLIRSP